MKWDLDRKVQVPEIKDIENCPKCGAKLCSLHYGLYSEPGKPYAKEVRLAIHSEKETKFQMYKGDKKECRMELGLWVTCYCGYWMIVACEDYVEPPEPPKIGLIPQPQSTSTDVVVCSTKIVAKDKIPITKKQLETAKEFAAEQIIRKAAQREVNLLAPGE